MKKILDTNQIYNVLEDIATRIVSDTPHESSLAVVGIRSRGEILAKRLAALLEQQTEASIINGTLDITLYRDDLNDPQGSVPPEVRTTEINFNVDDITIVLVDDVLFTGRSARAARDALIDLGRPRAIRLAVLVDREGREFPIQADYAGYKTDIAPERRVYVKLTESDGTDEVIID